MALNPSNGSNLEQLVLKGLRQRSGACAPSKEGILSTNCDPGPTNCIALV